jgi:threonine dehydratase
MLPATDTPLIRLTNLFAAGRVHAKCEFLARSGSFKIHGAAHLLPQLVATGRPRRLVVPSMGNTALAAAVGARAFGFTVTAVVPEAISRDKDEKLQAQGVELIKVAGAGSDILAGAAGLAEERGAYFVHPHLDPLWTDGYHALAAQVLRDLPDCRSLVFPVGGGGLLMGLSAYVQERRAAVHLYGCEAYNSPTYAAYSHARTPTIADGLVLDAPHPEVQQRIQAAGMAVPLVADADIRAAMRDLFRGQGLVVEPSAAVTVAFVKAHLRELKEPVCVILTGGNIAREDFDPLVAADA